MRFAITEHQHIFGTSFFFVIRVNAKITTSTSLGYTHHIHKLHGIKKTIRDSESITENHWLAGVQMNIVIKYLKINS